MFPMLAVVQSARELPSLEVEAFHLGSDAPVEQRILAAAGIPSRPLAVHGLRGSNPAALAWNALGLARAVRPALRVMAEFAPDVVFTTGGYASAPVVAAARLRRTPTLLFSADVAAGLAVRFEARLAQRIAVPVAEATAGLPAGRTFVSGYPVRPGLASLPAKDAAKEALGFAADRPLLLCFGGSQGARTLNQAITAGLDSLLAATQVLHLAGALDAASMAARPGYRVEAFLEDMPTALAAADLCVSRAGASTLGELPAAGVPAILVPYPYAGGHQQHNAEVLVRAGGAVLLPNDRAAEELVPLALSLLGDAQRLARMSAAMTELSRPSAARSLAEALLELAA
uniref:UDP-N-acetylglucosamine--N-acetylmuramyl-(pentapeptide) pyrophosphoryl-undecaprenol N-acetylglucosamine transferase n=1 Tax=uncultured bacterium 5E7 TaxID=1701324 RepID=A0A0N9HQP3_9BACT|nr:UDP-N-acetylglucosamine-N-acetylmuramyl- (pentapeptide) pyrophosphoryl-undecaprenol N- acetylglucosamine transferase [uncultured bacterium 5E7]